jgi:hypothetical protein
MAVSPYRATRQTRAAKFKEKKKPPPLNKSSGAFNVIG